MQSNSDPMVAIFGLLVMLLFVGGIIALMLFVWGTIFKKAGYSFWMSLLMLVPIANVVWLFVFAFSKWPIHQELEAYRAQHAGYLPNAFPVAPQGTPGQPPAAPTYR